MAKYLLYISTIRILVGLHSVLSLINSVCRIRQSEHE